MRRRAFLAGSAAAVSLIAMRPALGSSEAGGTSVRPLLALDNRFPVPGIAADGPQTVFGVSAASVYQGGALLVSASQGTGGSATFLGRDFPMVPTPSGLEGFISVAPDDPTGPAQILVAIDTLVGPEQFQATVTVLQTAWTVEYLTIPPPQSGDPDPLDPQEGAKEQARLGAVYNGRTPAVWKPHWVAPVAGPLTADHVTAYFGEQRSINGGPVGGHHGGTDIAYGFGSPILAVNDGTVVLSDLLVVRGNMIIIDHGGGVLSGYCHQSERHVALGDTVTQGQVIGAEGATGLVTGPHLHWEMCVGGVLVDGLRWLDGSQGF